MDSDNTRELLVEAANRAANYIEGLRVRDVRPLRGSVERLMGVLDGPLPDNPSRPTDVLALLDDYGSPATVASAGGRYFGFVTGGALPVTVAAQYLAAGWDQNCFSFISSPAVACIESTALRWVKEALGLPASAEGSLVTGASMANFTCLAAARNWILQQHGWDVDRQGLFGAPALTVVLGEEAHASIYKVLSMLGLGRDRILRVPSDDQGRMRPELLPPIEGPAIVCIQAGNVNSGAFDPASDVIEWARRCNAWVHVDGAFGLWALASPVQASRASGFVGADSWAMDAHKWLNTPYDGAMAICRDAEALSLAMNSDAAYLTAAKDAQKNLTMEFSRRARGIPIWAALRTLGREGVASLVDRHCAQARRIADGLREAGYEIVNRVVLNQVLVRAGSDEETVAIREAAQASGEVWFGPTVWQGRPAFRISVSSWRTTEEDVDRLIALLRRLKKGQAQ